MVALSNWITIYTSIPLFVVDCRIQKKAKALAQIEHLTVETVCKEKDVTALDRFRGETGYAPLPVYIQVNTSGEEQKAGVPCTDPSLLHTLVKGITGAEHLEFRGLMTIGAVGGGVESFETLASLRASLPLPSPLSVMLSMGMTSDFREAIAHGADIVRVGSAIFGAREYPPK
ncbi:uncharacterised protein family UPF0001 [Kipferlia bialata]|uniref:Alanine racemase N-terminal domain-containing protein n=1 Tax=Kipferlia bialata TaxID=797122 RepID=A0A9K3D791_9EUKA|nr:uncharacterised protein family UPF0001 [Kipferlia bialata]|eukprot:g12485.t1